MSDAENPEIPEEKKPRSTLQDGNADYGAKDLEHLSDLEHVRERPGMYIGDTHRPRAASPRLRSRRQLDRRSDGRLRHHRHA